MGACTADADIIRPCCMGAHANRRVSRRSSTRRAAVRAARSELAATGTAVRRPTTPRHSELTPQERTVAQLVATGLANREIAERLFVTTNTIETHLRHIFQKLDVRSRTQLAISFAGLNVAAVTPASPAPNITDSRDVSRDPPD